MGRVSIGALRKMGFSDEDIELAKITRAAQVKNGLPASSLAEICGVVKQEAKRSRIAKRGRAVEKALALDHSPVAPHDAGQCAVGTQLEFDLRAGGGNVTVGKLYFKTIKERLDERPLTLAQKATAFYVLDLIGHNLDWNKSVCLKTAADLAEMLPCSRQQMSKLLKILEDAGAIYRVQAGNEKAIVVDPKGMLYARFNDRHEVEEDFKDRLRVIDGGKGRAA